MVNAFEILANTLDIPYRTKDQRIWLLRTESGSFYQDFNINNYVALGWDKISKALIEKNDTTELREIIKQSYPTESKPGLILSQLRNFYYEMKSGDYIVIPSKYSKHLSIGILGEIIEKISHSKTDNEYVQCKYIHMRSVRWLNEIIPIHDIYISRVLKSHQAITNITEFANVLYRNIFPLYIDEECIHLTLQKPSDSEMKLWDNIKLQEALYNIMSSTSSLYGDIDIENTAIIKTAVGSPGFIEVIVKAAPLIPALLFVKSIIGKRKDKDGNYVEGFCALISQITNCFNAKVDRDYKRAEIEEKEILNEEKRQLMNIKIEKEKAELRKLSAEAQALEIKNLEAIQALKRPNTENIDMISQNAGQAASKLIEVADNNSIKLPS